MAAEARAMLDALMGSDRNDVSTNAPATSASSWSAKNKKSCYDSDICPLYCAWGIDVYDLFTNTKSALGSNPYVCQPDARVEFEGLPDHEKDRLGYEGMLCRKLSDLVRGCDRIVMRNKEKLRQEISKAAKARGDTINIATNVKEELIVEAGECMAELEMKEEEVTTMIQQLETLDGDWKGMWKEFKALEKQIELDRKKQKEQQEQEKMKEMEKDVKEEPVTDIKKEETTEEENVVKEDPVTQEPVKQEDTSTEETKEAAPDAKEGESTSTHQEPNPETKTESESETLESKLQTLQTQLYKNSSLQQKLLTKLNTSTSQSIVPLRDTLQNLTKQLYYIRTDTSYDKTVCDVSGNFMSSRDAEERIAAHYAGKQYVGWKMVREKLKELEQKLGRGGGPQSGPRGGPGGYGGGPGYGGGYGGGGPPNHRGPPPPGYYHGGSSSHRGGDRRGDQNRRERSRSRDRSDGRWERDRGGSSHSSSSHRGYKSSSGRHGGGGGAGGGRRDRRYR